MTICDTGVVSFPMFRDEQSADLMALAGDALLRGDHIAWQVLFIASKNLEGAPDMGTPEAEIENLRIRATVGVVAS